MKPSIQNEKASMQRTCENSTPYKVVDASDPQKACENCGNDGKWLFWIQRYLCDPCKDRLITPMHCIPFVGVADGEE